MSWGDAIRRPRVYGERRPEHEACPGDERVLAALRAAGDHWTPMEALGGYAGSQAVYRLRNTHGADFIETLTGRGYRLSKRAMAELTEAGA